VGFAEKKPLNMAMVPKKVNGHGDLDGAQRASRGGLFKKKKGFPWGLLQRELKWLERKLLWQKGKKDPSPVLGGEEGKKSLGMEEERGVQRLMPKNRLAEQGIHHNRLREGKKCKSDPMGLL